MKYLKTAVIIILGMTTLLILASFLLPRQVHVERTIMVDAPANIIYNQVNTLKNWENWSPWHKLDPEMTLVYSGPASGVGSKYIWESKKVGSGALTITESHHHSFIATEMDFMEQGTATSNFRFEPLNGGTQVTWSMDTDMGLNPISKYMGLFMDRMVGADFEKGLANLKDFSEKWAASIPVKIEERKIDDQYILTIRAQCTPDEVSQQLANIYGQISTFMNTKGLKPTGSPFAIYHSFSTDEIDMEAGIPINREANSAENIRFQKRNGGKVIMVEHHGSYDKIGNIHDQVNQWIIRQNKKVIGSPWEVYVTDPQKEKDTSKWITEIYYPIK